MAKEFCSSCQRRKPVGEPCPFCGAGLRMIGPTSPTIGDSGEVISGQEAADPFPNARELANETYGDKMRRQNRERQARWRERNKDRRAAYMREWRAKRKVGAAS